MTQTAQPIIGIGAIFSIGTQTASPTYTPILKIKKLGPPKPKWGTEETTTLDTAGLTKTFIKTLIDAGEVSVEGVYESADPGQIALEAAMYSAPIATYGQAYPFKLALPIDVVGGQTTTGDTVAFNGLVLGFEIGDIEPEKEITFSSSIKITGAPTVTEGA